MAAMETKIEPVWMKQKFGQLVDCFVPIFELVSYIVVFVLVGEICCVNVYL